MIKKLRIILILICLNAAVTSWIYRLKHPDKTETQVFLHSLKSFIYDFE